MLFRKVLVLLIAMLLIGAGPVFSAGRSQEKFEAFVQALHHNRAEEMVFSESEALTLVNAAAEVMFSDMPWVSATCSTVSFRNGRIEVNTVLRVGALNIRPQVTFTTHVSGDFVIINITRMRVGVIPISVAATLSAINLAGPPPYMEISPWLGRIVIEKRGSVANVREVGVEHQQLRLRLGLQ